MDKKMNILLWVAGFISVMAVTACTENSKQENRHTQKTNESMEFLELVKTRRSIRNYLPQEVEQEKLDYIMETVRLAPSAANIQPWYFYIIQSEEAKKAVTESYPARWMATAPMYIVACGNSEVSWKRNSYDGKDYVDVDVAIAFEHLCLAAAEQGLGTCWIAHFDPEKITALLNIPSHLTPVAITPLGYPHPEQGQRTPRKKMEEIREVR